MGPTRVPTRLSAPGTLQSRRVIETRRCAGTSSDSARPSRTHETAVTDTGHTAELLDLAQRAWPEITDRRQLLLRLTEMGGEALGARLVEHEHRRERQRLGLERAAQLVDVDALLGDQAWR